MLHLHSVGAAGEVEELSQGAEKPTCVCPDLL